MRIKIGIHFGRSHRVCIFFGRDFLPSIQIQGYSSFGKMLFRDNDIGRVSTIGNEEEGIPRILALHGFGINQYPREILFDLPLLFCTVFFLGSYIVGIGRYDE
jgi:hypothetical protein